MQRITQKQLEILVDQINQATGSPLATYTRRNSKLIANIGNYLLDYTHNGVRLAQIVNKEGATREVSHDGAGTKRQLHAFMTAFLDGIAISKE